MIPIPALTDDQDLVPETLIAAVVHGFYDKVRAHPELGPIFDGVIGDHWDTHLNTMVDFWSALLRRSGRYAGQPMRKHLALAGVGPEHFVIWLALFHQTCEELCTPEQGLAFTERAERIAKSFQLGMFYRPEGDRAALA